MKTLKQCFELINDQHRKFWTVEVYGLMYFATFGRIGTKGQTQVKTFATNFEAMDQARDMIDEKTNKGYRQVDAVKHPGVSPIMLARFIDLKVPVKQEEP